MNAPLRDAGLSLPPLLASRRISNTTAGSLIGWDGTGDRTGSVLRHRFRSLLEHPERLPVRIDDGVRPGISSQHRPFQSTKVACGTIAVQFVDYQLDRLPAVTHVEEYGLIDAAVFLLDSVIVRIHVDGVTHSLRIGLFQLESHTRHNLWCLGTVKSELEVVALAELA